MPNFENKKYIYFDNAASTKVLKSARQAALDAMDLNFANPSSLHEFGLSAEKILISTKKTLALALNCDSNEIIFTPSATISSNLAIIGSVLSLQKGNTNKKKIITTTIEHAATQNCINSLENKGFKIVRIKPKNKIYNAEDFINEIDNSTCLISLMHVNNENGLILPIEKVAKLAKLKNPNVLVHIDCVQSFTKIPIDLKKIPADFVSISGHKINAPKGIAALFIRKKSKIKPIFFGGGQENGLCSGTQNVPAIAGLQEAVKFHLKNLYSHQQHYKNLKQELIKNCKECPQIKFNFEENHSADHIVNVSVEPVRSQVMLNFLEMNGFLISSASACAKGKLSHVLTNLGYSPKRQDCAIRISFSFQNTLEEVIKLAQTIIQGSKNLIT